MGITSNSTNVMEQGTPRGMSRQKTGSNPVGSTSNFLSQHLDSLRGKSDEHEFSHTNIDVFGDGFDPVAFERKVAVLNPSVKVENGPTPDCKIIYDFVDTEREISLFDPSEEREIAVEGTPDE